MQPVMRSVMRLHLCAMPKIVVLVSSLLAYSGTAFAEPPPIPGELAAEVQGAERVGRSLFLAFNKADPSVSPTIAKAVAAAEAKSVEHCNVPYRRVVIPSGEETGSSLYVFLIGTPPPTVGIMGGRHFRIEVASSTDEVIAVKPSTVSCFFIPRMSEAEALGKKPVAAFMSHLLSSVPTEFHVFMSMLHQTPFYVATSTGDWIVEGDKISYVRPR